MMGCGMGSIYPAEALCSVALRRSSADSLNKSSIEKPMAYSPKLSVKTNLNICQNRGKNKS